VILPDGYDDDYDQEYRVTFPKTVLENAGDYFKKCLNGQFAEAGSREIELKDVKSHVFLEFEHWLYNGQIDTKSCADPLNLFTELIVFGDRIQSTELQNDVMLMFETIRHMPDERWLTELRTVLKDVRECHPYRRLVAAFTAWNALHAADDSGERWPSQESLDEIYKIAKDHKDFLEHFGGQLMMLKSREGALWPTGHSQNYFVANPA
jgi:BTB/POZ domain